MNKNDGIEHATKEEQLIFMVEFYKNFLKEIKETLEQLESDLEEERSLKKK